MRISVKKTVISAVASIALIATGLTAPTVTQYANAATDSTTAEPVVNESTVEATPEAQISEEPAIPDCRGANDQWLSVNEGNLKWGVLSSFTNYIKGIARGEWETTEGVQWNESTKQFDFPVKSGYFNVTDHKLVVQYRGKIHFTGHGGKLDLTISDPKLVAQRGGESYLYVSMQSKEMEGTEIVDYGRVPLVKLSEISHNLDGNMVDLTAVKALLTAEGVPAFGGFYEVDREFDSVNSNFATSEMSVCDTEPGDTTPSTPETTPENPHIVTEPVVPICGAQMMSINSGTLNWGIRESFTNYIKGMAHGSWETTNGVEWNESTKQFNFPVRAGYYDMTTHKTVVQYQGTVHFTGHNGALDMWVVDPTLVVDPQAGNTIIASMPKDGSAESLAATPRFVLATVGQVSRPTFANGMVSLNGSGVAFTTTGVSAFGNFYANDPHMDSFSTSLAMSSMPQCEDGPEAPLKVEMMTAPVPEVAPFSDISPTDMFAGEIEWMKTSGITTGYPNGNFYPLGKVTREAMAAFLYRAAGSPDVAVSGTPFTDVPENSKFAKEITWMMTTEISTGYKNGTFRPHALVTRDAMAAFLYRFCNTVESGCNRNLLEIRDMPMRAKPFEDVPEGTQFETEINWMRDAKISTGWSDNTYRPYLPIARNAMAAFLYRLKFNTVQ